MVNFPAGIPPPFPVPAVYKALATLPPGAVVSLPDYSDTAAWFQEADYQYYSTAHWHPIANGYSRSAPAGFRDLMNRLSTFPSASSAETMRTVGVRYVVFHGRRLGNGLGLTSQAVSGGEFHLLAQRDDDYLFEVLPAAAPPR